MELFAHNKQQSAVGSALLLCAVFVLVGIVFAGCMAPTQTNEVKDTVPPVIEHRDVVNTTDTKPGVDKVNETIAQAVADGTYEKEATYAFHSGTEHVHFEISVENDIVTAVSVHSENPSNPVSRNIIANFGEELPALVVGRKITELDLPQNVAGSSLTNAAFKTFVAEVIENN